MNQHRVIYLLDYIQKVYQKSLKRQTWDQLKYEEDLSYIEGQMHFKRKKIWFNKLKLYFLSRRKKDSQSRQAKQHYARLLKSSFFKVTKRNIILRERLIQYLSDKTYNLKLKILKQLSIYSILSQKKYKKRSIIYRKAEKNRKRTIFTQWGIITQRNCEKRSKLMKITKKLSKFRRNRIFSQWRDLSQVHSEIIRYRLNEFNSRQWLRYGSKLIVKLKAWSKMQRKGRQLDAKVSFKRLKLHMLMWFIQTIKVQEKKQRFREYLGGYKLRRYFKVFESLKKNVKEKQERRMMIQILKSNTSQQLIRRTFQVMQVYTQRKKQEFFEERQAYEMYTQRRRKLCQNQFIKLINQVNKEAQESKSVQIQMKIQREAQLAQKYAEKWIDFVQLQKKRNKKHLGFQAKQTHLSKIGQLNKREQQENQPQLTNIFPKNNLQQPKMVLNTESKVTAQKSDVNYQRNRTNQEIIELEEILKIKIEFYDIARQQGNPVRALIKKEIKDLYEELQSKKKFLNK